MRAEQDSHEVPAAICKADYHDFGRYMGSLEMKEPGDGKVPDSTWFCLDEERNIFVGAINIRHELNDALRLFGGHIGSAKSIRNNGGVLENEVSVNGVLKQRYWISNVLQNA